MLLVVAMAAAGFAGPARADTITHYATSGDLSASVTFTITDGTLTILLTNTATVDPTASSRVLTGVFFDLAAILAPMSAILPTGSSIIQADECSTDCAGEANVGGEFNYSTTAAWFAPLATHGISSSGYLPSNAASGGFGGSDLDEPVGLNGANFGIVNAGFVPGSGNGGLDNDPLIQSSVLFTFTIVGWNPTAPLLAASIDPHSIYFTYGTSPDHVVNVPEPTSLLLLGVGLLGIAAFARRR